MTSKQMSTSALCISGHIFDNMMNEGRDDNVEKANNNNTIKNTLQPLQWQEQPSRRSKQGVSNRNMTALTPIAVAGVFAGLYLHHSLLHSMIQENSRQTDITYELMAAKAIGHDGENNDNIVKEEDFQNDQSTTNQSQLHMVTIADKAFADCYGVYFTKMKIYAENGGISGRN
jgi:hypothetical protein